MNLECCTPYRAPFPSGWHWVHSKTCSLASMRGQKVRMHTTHPAGTAIDHKPVAASSPLLTWFEHDHDRDGTPRCFECSYVEHHLDWNDDRWGDDHHVVV